MLRGILFDFNGVLVDDEPLHLALFAQVLAEEGIALTPERYYADYLGFDDKGCFAAAFADAGRRLDEIRLAALIERKARYYAAEAAAHGFPFFPGALDCIRAAAAAGLVLGVVSGALRQEIEGALAAGGVRPLFATVVAAEDVCEGKPHPEGYRRGSAALASALPPSQPALAPAEIVAIEDSPAGLAAARDAGLRTLGVAHTYNAGELSLAEAVVASLAGLSPARLHLLLAAP